MESGDELAASGIGRTAAKEKNSVVSEAYRSRDRYGMGAFCTAGAVGAVPDSTDFRKYRDRLLHGADDMGETFNQTTVMDDVFFVRGKLGIRRCHPAAQKLEQYQLVLEQSALWTDAVYGIRQTGHDSGGMRNLTMGAVRKAQKMGAAPKTAGNGNAAISGQNGSGRRVDRHRQPFADAGRTFGGSGGARAVCGAVWGRGDCKSRNDAGRLQWLDISFLPQCRKNERTFAGGPADGSYHTDRGRRETGSGGMDRGGNRQCRQYDALSDHPSSGLVKEDLMVIRVSVPNQFQFKMIPTFQMLLKPKQGEVHYIGGSDVLPMPLDSETEQIYIGMLGGGQSAEARKMLIEHNLRLVVYIAKKFDNTGVGVEDLISIGTIGLIKAINTFNSEKKIKLATYASRCIENEILMYLRRNSKTRLEVSIDEPLNVDWDGNELLLSDILGTEEDIIYRDIEDEVERNLLLHAVNTLSEREKQIVELRFGLNRRDGKEMTQKQVADLLGISQSYISRLEKKIMKRLKREMVRYEM